jgi:hypothetical protein
MVSQALNAVVIDFFAIIGGGTLINHVTSFRHSKTQPWAGTMTYPYGARKVVWQTNTKLLFFSCENKQTFSSNFTLISCHAELSSIRKQLRYTEFGRSRVQTRSLFDAFIQSACITGQPEPEPDAASGGLKKLARKLPRS